MLGAGLVFSLEVVKGRLVPHTMSLEIIPVKKIEAANRQLQTAITLWFADADQISVHTLACAAHQIIHDINTKRKDSKLLLNSDVINEEFRKEYLNEMRKAMRFFKHADKDPDPHGMLEFTPAITDLFILFSIIGLKRLDVSQSEMAAAFLLFYAIKNPNLIVKEFSCRFKIENMNLPVVSKSEFLDQFIQVCRVPRCV